MLKRTALFSAHQKLGAKLVDFGGWEMPVQYTSITDEHLAVRNAAGLFDISHMGEVTVNGAGAVEFLNRTLTNDIRKLGSGQGQYTLMCNERGGVVDDLYAYRLSVDVYLLIINASRADARSRPSSGWSAPFWPHCWPPGWRPCACGPARRSPLSSSSASTFIKAISARLLKPIRSRPCC